MRALSVWVIEFIKLIGIRRLHPINAECTICHQTAGGVAADPPTKAERVALTIELARNAAKLAKAACTVLDGRSPSLRDSLNDRAQLHDCTIIDVQGALRYPRQGLVEGVLFGSGRPLILTPANASPPVKERVVVAWDGTPAAVRALHDAIPLLVEAQEVIVVSVTGDKEFTASESGPHVCRYLRRWDVTSRFDLIERGGRNVGDALVDHAIQTRPPFGNGQLWASA
jgi:hypothetical protein